MKIKRLGWLALFASLITACSTAPQKPAPVVERTPGVHEAVGPGYYRVKRGDTLNRIAHRHGQSAADLVRWNNLSNPNDIKVGSVLRVQRSGTHAVRERAPVMSAATVTAPSGVEVKPLAPAQSANVASVKTAPRGEKQPYSEEALAAMKTAGAGGTSVAAAPIVKPVAGTPAAAVAKPADAAAPEDKISWMWPSDGKILASFQGKSKGIDISGKSGQKVLAAADGKVMFASNRIRGYGNLVIVKHTETIQSVYAHNSKILVKEGQAVTKGQPIAEMGNTDSDVVKLHFEIRRQGKPVDPARYLPAR